MLIKVIGDDILYDRVVVAKITENLLPTTRIDFVDDLETDFKTDFEKADDKLCNIEDGLVDPELLEKLANKIKWFVDCKTKAERQKLVDALVENCEEIKRDLEYLCDLKNSWGD